MSKKETNEQVLGKGFYAKIERAGNKIPNPMVLFVWFAVIILVASFICGTLGVSATNPATGEVVTAVNLL